MGEKKIKDLSTYKKKKVLIFFFYFLFFITIMCENKRERESREINLTICRCDTYY